MVSFVCPVVMVSRCRTRMAARLGLTGSGRSSGKNEITGSSTDNNPADTARPTPVEVKLLLREKSMCRCSAA